MSALYMGGVNYRLQKIETATAYYLEAEVEVEKPPIINWDIW